MVRLKTRWILLRVDFEEHFGGSDNRSLSAAAAAAATSPLSSFSSRTKDFPSRKEIFFAVHDSHIENFGFSASGEAFDCQVRFCDPYTRLVMIRVLRKDLAKIRSTLTLLTKLGGQNVLLSILCVNGNTRTAKRSATQEVLRIYRRYFKRTLETTTTATNYSLSQVCSTLEGTLAELSSIEF